MSGTEQGTHLVDTHHAGMVGRASLAGLELGEVDAGRVGEGLVDERTGLVTEDDVKVLRLL